MDTAKKNILIFSTLRGKFWLLIHRLLLPRGAPAQQGFGWEILSHLVYIDISSKTTRGKPKHLVLLFETFFYSYSSWLWRENTYDRSAVLNFGRHFFSSCRSFRSSRSINSGNSSLDSNSRFNSRSRFWKSRTLELWKTRRKEKDFLFIDSDLKIRKTQRKIFFGSSFLEKGSYFVIFDWWWDSVALEERQRDKE